MKLSVVTSNLGKLKEFRNALLPAGIEVMHSEEDCDEIQADDLEDVVRHCMNQLKDKGVKDFVIDDSGLFVHALKGFPGVYSAYAFKTIGNPGLLRLLEEIDDRTAHFECCIGCCIGGSGGLVVKERCEGRIIEKGRGEYGFGFDPIFIPEGYDQTFAEMPLELKNRISHRGKAIKSFVAELNKTMKSGRQ